MSILSIRGVFGDARVSPEKSVILGAHGHGRLQRVTSRCPTSTGDASTPLAFGSRLDGPVRQRIVDYARRRRRVTTHGYLDATMPCCHLFHALACGWLGKTLAQGERG